MIKPRIWKAIPLLILACSFFTSRSQAQDTLSWSIVDAGGTSRTSAHFQVLDDSLSYDTIGTQQSSNFSAHLGFIQLFPSVTATATATATNSFTLTSTTTFTATATLTPTPTPTGTNTPLGPTATATPIGAACGTSPVGLQLKEFTTCGANQTQQNFEVINSGTTALNLNQITIKFWVDDTNVSANPANTVMGAVNFGGGFGSSFTAVTGVAINTVNFPACGPSATQQANWEITVSNNDTATLPAGATWNNIQTAIHVGSSFINFVPGTADWFSPCGVGGGSTYTSNVNYALYYQGNLVTASGGVPPSCRPLATCTPGGSGSTSTATSTPTSTRTVVATASFTPSPTATRTNTPPASPSAISTATFTPTASFTPSPTATRTNTPLVSPSVVFTATSTPTASFTSSATATRTNTPLATPSVASTATSTPTFTRTPAATASFTTSLTATRTNTPPATSSPTPTPTRTNTPLSVATATFTVGTACGTSPVGLQLKEFTSCQSNQAQQNFEVINTGTTALNLGQITIKFWVDDTNVSSNSANGVLGAVNFGGGFGSTSTAVSGVAIHTLNFPACGPSAAQQANWEITISDTDTASLSAGATWSNIQTAIHAGNSFVNFTPGSANWYSPCVGSTYMDNLNYALYYQGNLVTSSGGVPSSCRPLATCTPGGPASSAAALLVESRGTATPTISTTPTGSFSAMAEPNISRNGEPVKFVVNLVKPSLVKLALLTLTGEQVYGASFQGNTGTNSFVWTLQNQAKETVASGLYVYVLQADDGLSVTNKTGKVVVLR